MSKKKAAPPNDLPGEELRQRLDTLTQNIIQAQEHEQLAQEIETILEDAKPENLVPGTMDVDKLASVFDSMHEELTKEELDEIVQAMNEEYVESPESA